MKFKPKEILVLEKIYGITLEKISLSEDITRVRNRNCYQLDSNKKIVGLNLDENQISDITPLQELTQLTSLALFNNQISDITSLQQLTQLNILSLGKL